MHDPWQPLQSFALGLTPRLRPGESAVFSPASLSLSLALLLEGAAGAPADAAGGILGVPDLRGIEKALGRLEAACDGEAPGNAHDRAAGRAPGALRIANGLFHDPALRLRDDYVARVRSAYAADVRPVDFGSAPEAARLVNEWVSRHTGGRIDRLLEPGMIRAAGGGAPGPTGLILANALYFSGRWREMFQMERTAPAPFHREGGGTVDVPMMSMVTTVHRVRDPARHFAAVALPYELGAGTVRRNATMLVVLPDPGRREDVERALDMAFLRSILDHGESVRVDLRLPLLALQTRSDLTSLIRDAGLAPLLDPASADFRDMAHPEDVVGVDAIVQAARLEVDEVGTEGAAATLTEMLGAARQPPPPVPFVVDRPYLLAVYESVSRTALFVARVMEPTPPGPDARRRTARLLAEERDALMRFVRPDP